MEYMYFNGRLKINIFLNAIDFVNNGISIGVNFFNLHIRLILLFYLNRIFEFTSCRVASFR